MVYASMTNGFTGTIDLSTMIEFTSDFTGCSEYSLTSYTDEAMSVQTTNTGTYFATNPSLRDLTSGGISKTLNFVVGTTGKPTNVFIQGQTNPQIQAAVSAGFSLEFMGCNEL